MSELSKQYDPKMHETDVYAAWEAAGIFQPDQRALDEGKQPFVIMLPPPNITGSLHMGHALQDTIMDMLVRYHRMLGEPVLWLPGTDHAAIATNRVLEKQLTDEGVSRQQIGREAFLRRAQSWYEDTGAVILHQMKRLGCSCDWTRQRFTMDAEYYQAVQEAFVQYHEKGFIYRGNRMVNWCPHCESVVSDLEIQHEQRSTRLVTLRYSFVDGSGFIDVATTRPETMLGDTAVAVHPDDERYKDSIGKVVRVPLVDREVPVIADERIEPSFGTGAVKVTPAHDSLDAQLGETHKLQIINVVGEDGRMTDAAGSFAGMTVKEARKAIVEALREQKVVVQEEDYSHKASVCERCGTGIEPLISRQWFVDMGKLKTETIEVAENELVKFVPTRWKKHFLQWMQDVHDWTISRQIWLGHRIPVWWKPGTRGTNSEEGNFVVSAEKPEGEWEQDPDVLDTWFSSALWPFATLGWPNQTPDLKAFYPTSVLVTGRDILYLWVARMMFSGLELLKDTKFERPEQADRIPFHEVFIYPTVLAKTGQRMSKSLGTGIDPLDLIDQYGADATRFGLIYQMSFDQQAMKFDENAIKAARNFGNKVWNIARLLDSLEESDTPTVADSWIEARSGEVATQVTQLFEQYRFGEAAHVIHDFVWKDFADWYMEVLKVEGSTVVAKRIFTQTLQLLHPYMPHVTEVLWKHFGQEAFIATSKWPQAAVDQAGDVHEAMQYFQHVVETIRSARTLLKIQPGAEVDAYVAESVFAPMAAAKMAQVQWTDSISKAMRQFPLPAGGTVAIGSEYITEESVAAARAKLQQEGQALQSSVTVQTKTLEGMRAKAPQTVIQEKEATLAQSQTRLEEINRSLSLLE
ncbi:MAG: valine--tRNA ligase [Candidatus Andersenbacteria bacterium]